MKNAFFSVIIPTLNEENYLPKLLSDFAKQKQKNFCVIVVDANSVDKTKQRALKFSKFFPLTFYTVDKQNVSYQRNVGSQKAKGVYLLFLDADARIGTMFTKNLATDILKKKGSLFLPTLIAEYGSAKNRALFKLINYAVELSQFLTKPLSSGGSLFLSKKLFSDLKGFRENLYMSEDHDLVQRARKQGVKAKFLKDIKVMVCFRRMKKEGQIIVLYKYLLALVYMLINEEITNKIFRYEMGGDKYRGLKLKDGERSFKGEAVRYE